jgi:hypothetical protein
MSDVARLYLEVYNNTTKSPSQIDLSTSTFKNVTFGASLTAAFGEPTFEVPVNQKYIPC